MARKTKSTFFPFDVRIPEQAIALTFNDGKDAELWFEEQRKFWQAVREFLGNQIVLNSRSVNMNEFFNGLDRDLNQAKEQIVGENEGREFQNFVLAARELKIVIAGGNIGALISDAMTENTKENVVGFILVYCSKWLPNHIRLSEEPLVSIANALVFGHPATGLLSHANDIRSAKTTITALAKEYKTLAQSLERSKSDVDQRAFEWEKEFGAIKATYEAHLKLKEPANYWSKRRDISLYSAGAAFVIFLFVLGLSTYVAYHYSGQLLQFAKSNSASENQWLGGLVFVAVPVGAIAWVLRHVSRVFVQSLNNADDAAFRKALVSTYLSIIQNVNEDLKDQDRALILNALFRPGPAEPHDEGPPAGLIELSRGHTR